MLGNKLDPETDVKQLFTLQGNKIFSEFMTFIYAATHPESEAAQKAFSEYPNWVRSGDSASHYTLVTVLEAEWSEIPDSEKLPNIFK